jgi:multiple sugar transport system substrate-binding protein
MASSQNGGSFGLSRRAFLGASLGVASTALLAACTGGGGGGGSSSGGVVKFWNMPWGGTGFNPLDKKITLDYKPASGLPGVSYQVIQWANFTQTFASAIASNTGPAVSSGGGTQAFQFASQGKIAYADDLLDSWKKDGLYDDFLPDILDTMKTKEGYAAIPYNLDLRVSWYSKPLMEKAGVEPPTDWQSYMDVCEALKKIGVYGFGIGSGSGNYTGTHVITAFMISNGGGLFDENQQPNCVTPKNIEALEYILELVNKGYSDPAAATYTSDNVQSQWKAGKFGFGWDGAGLATNIGGTVGPTMAIGDPLTSANGTKGTINLIANIMMYKNTPSQKGTEAFLTYYYKNMSPLWTKNTGIGLPVLKSITQTKEFKADANAVKVIDKWVPVSKTWGAPGNKGLFLNVVAVDGTEAMNSFAQSVLGGKTDAKTALTTLQAQLKRTLPKA